jgi:tRNA pseudouridine38-40 synthase
MPTYKLTIEYEGTRYSGWQAQGNTQKTVQGHLIRAATQVIGEVDVGGAGRTDAGVHASGQVAHLRARKAVDAVPLQRKLNDLLPHDIHVLHIARADDSFHARHDAVSRIYLYQIATRRTAFAKSFVWWIKDALDANAIKRAAAAVSGRHDFTAFTDKRLAADESRIVVVESCQVAVEGDLILVRIAASHFLWKMVRKLVAALVELGRGTMSAQAFAALLGERASGPQSPGVSPGDDRSRAGRPTAAGETPALQTAPPSGLFLEAVLYPGETFDRPLIPLVPINTVLPRRGQR